jgi:hypothetical protein
LPAYRFCLRVQADVAALALPLAPFLPCAKLASRVSFLPLVRYRNNDYAAPMRYDP